jgi:phenylpyruvate tautomerase PptA (4-oxalocrotonate tautomerase family)
LDQEHLLIANNHRGYRGQPQRRMPDVLTKRDDELRDRHSPVSNRDRHEDISVPTICYAQGFTPKLFTRGATQFPVLSSALERTAVMPLARIDLIEGKSVEYRRTIADVVYDKMIECLGVPEDRFQTITEHKAENFFFDRDYLGLYRSENCIFIQLIFLDVASPEQKAAFYKAVVDQLQEKLQARREDVFFNLMTVQPADWSMGNGEATYINGVPTDRLDPNSIGA